MNTDPTPNPEEFSPDTLLAALEQDADKIGQIKTADDVMNVALEVLDSTLEGQELMDRISKSRGIGKEDIPAINQRRRLWNEMAVEISLITGIEIDQKEHDDQKRAYQAQLRSILADIDPKAGDEEIMLRLDMIRPAPTAEDPDKRVFNFPSRILPPYIKDQWRAYMGMVGQFEDAEYKLKKGVISQVDFNAIDLNRRSAHNTVSESVAQILEFPGWGPEDYRTLVAKWRDEKFAKPMGETARYAELVRDKILPKPEHLTHIHKALGRHGVAATGK